MHFFKKTKTTNLLKVWCHCPNTYTHLLSYRISKSSVGLRSMVMRKTGWGSGKVSASNWELFPFLVFKHTKKISRINFTYIFSLKKSHYKLLVCPKLESANWWLVFSTPLKFLKSNSFHNIIFLFICWCFGGTLLAKEYLSWLVQGAFIRDR